MRNKTILNIKKLLEDYGIKSVKQSGKQVYFCCPFHEDTTPSACMSAENGIFHCFGCGVKGTLEAFIAKMPGTAPKSARDITEKTSLLDQDFNLVEYIREQLLPQKAASPLNEAILKEFNTQIHTGILKRVPNKVLLKKFELGYSLKHKKTTLPIRDHLGKLVGVIGRAIGRVQPKYKPLIPIIGFKKSQYLYGLHLCKGSSTIVLCEGEFDALNFYNSGAPYAVALMGCKLSKKQCDLLTRYTQHVLLALDNDLVGQRATQKIITQLRGLVKMSLFKYVVDKKDPGELTAEEIQRGLKEAERVL